MTWSHFSSDGSRKTVTESTISGASGNAVRATKSSPQAITTATWTTVTFDGEDHDYGSLHDNVTNNSRLTAATTGVYHVEASVGWEVNLTGDRLARLVKNGAVYISTTGDTTTSSVGTGPVSNISTSVYLNAGDYIELQVYQNSGGNLNVEGLSWQNDPYLAMTLADTVIIDGSGAGRVLGYAEGLFVTSAGSGDKLSITVTDPPGDVLVYAGALASSSGAAGTSVQIQVFDGAGGTGVSHTQAYFHSPAPNYYSQLSTPARKVARWSGSKTFYLRLNNSAGTPTIWGNGGGAVCTLIAELCS